MNSHLSPHVPFLSRYGYNDSNATFFIRCFLEPIRFAPISTLAGNYVTHEDVANWFAAIGEAYLRMGQLEIAYNNLQLG